jgi:hypothetical protein
MNMHPGYVGTAPVDADVQYMVAHTTVKLQ